MTENEAERVGREALQKALILLVSTQLPFSVPLSGNEYLFEIFLLPEQGEAGPEADLPAAVEELPGDRYLEFEVDFPHSLGHVAESGRYGGRDNHVAGNHFAALCVADRLHHERVAPGALRHDGGVAPGSGAESRHNQLLNRLRALVGERKIGPQPLPFEV